jgi:hypothetical protein
MKFLKCACSSCGGRIEFPADAIGSPVTCPHCGTETELVLPEPDVVPNSPSRRIKWAIVGVCILVVGLAGGIIALNMAKKLVPSERSSRDLASNRVVAPAISAPEARTHTNDFTSSEVQIEWQPGSTLGYASGTIVNLRAAQRFGVTVRLDVFNAADGKVGTAQDYREVIEPNAEWRFRALLLNTNAASARVSSVQEQP